MPHRILGLHHATATVADAQDDLDFCLGPLGLRLVKKTVNFDNPHVYHFYYGDEQGTPGTILTTFPYDGWAFRREEGRGADHGDVVFGAGGIAAILDRAAVVAGVDAIEGRRRFRTSASPSSDPSGLTIELVASAADDRDAVAANTISDESAIRGIHSVTLIVQRPEKTLAFMNELLDTSVVDEAEGRMRVAVNGTRRAAWSTSSTTTGVARHERHRHRAPCRDGD